MQSYGAVRRAGGPKPIGTLSSPYARPQQQNMEDQADVAVADPADLANDSQFIKVSAKGNLKAVAGRSAKQVVHGDLQHENSFGGSCCANAEGGGAVLCQCCKVNSVSKPSTEAHHHVCCLLSGSCKCANMASATRSAAYASALAFSYVGFWRAPLQPCSLLPMQPCWLLQAR